MNDARFNVVNRSTIMQLRALILVLAAILAIFSTTLVSGHEGESTDGLTNFQILLISIVISACIYFLVSRFIEEREYRPSPLVFTLVTFTGSVHILLGLSDYLLLIGGVGVIGILGLSLIVNLSPLRDKIARLGLGLVVAIMFVAYFVSNHDLHYIIEDYLGIITKLAELSIIILITRERKQIANNSQEE